MSEFWVSGKKYFCELCRIYIQDNKPSRQMHETGNKHKYNVSRHLRDIQRKQDNKTRDEARTQRLLQQVEQSALRQYTKDLDTGAFPQDSKLQLTTGVTLPGRPLSMSGMPPRRDPSKLQEPQLELEQRPKTEQDCVSGEGQEQEQDLDGSKDADTDAGGEADPDDDGAQVGRWTTVEPAEASAESAAIPMSAAEAYAAERQRREDERRAARQPPPSDARAYGRSGDSVHAGGDDDDDDVDGGGSNLRQFRLTEKRLAVDLDAAHEPVAATAAGLFKRRKVGKARSLRTRDGGDN